MKKRTLYIIIAVILILALVLSFNKLTGFYTIPGGETRGCYDTDSGLNYFERGSVRFENRDYSYIDECISKLYVKEYYCFTDSRIKSKKYQCEKGCKDGACVK